MLGSAPFSPPGRVRGRGQILTAFDMGAERAPGHPWREFADWFAAQNLTRGQNLSNFSNFFHFSDFSNFPRWGALAEINGSVRFDQG